MNEIGKLYERLWGYYRTIEKKRIGIAQLNDKSIELGINDTIFNPENPNIG